MVHLDREQAYLCALARAWSRGETTAVAAPAGLDRERFLYLVASQPAMQTLAPLIDPDALPAAQLSQHTLAVEIARRRTTVMLLELERVLPALAERRCRPVVLKGGSLALMAYPRPEDRWFLDLDLLVERSELPEVYAALQRLGYRFANTACPARYYEDYHFHRILISNQGVCIEVHWALTMPASVYTYDLDALRRDSVEIPLGGASFLAPGVSDQILHGAMQNIAGGFGDLRRVLDLHLLDERLDEPARRLLCARARTCNLATGLWLQYRLREQLLAAPMPASIAEACRPAPRLVRMFGRLEVAKNSLSPHGGHLEGYDYLLHCLCVPSHLWPREAWRYLFPDQGGLLEAGLGREGTITLRQRARLHLSRLRAAARLLGWLVQVSRRHAPCEAPATC